MRDSGPEALLVAAPSIVLGALCVVLVLLGAFSRNPYWSGTPLNMAEAAATRDIATVALLLDRGVDPNEQMPVPAGFVGPDATRVTPAEAAIVADRIEILALLLDNGALADRAQVCRWLALAERAEADESAEYLSARYASWAPLCSEAAFGQ